MNFTLKRILGPSSFYFLYIINIFKWQETSDNCNLVENRTEIFFLFQLILSLHDEWGRKAPFKGNLTAKRREYYKDPFFLGRNTRHSEKWARVLMTSWIQTGKKKKRIRQHGKEDTDAVVHVHRIAYVPIQMDRNLSPSYLSLNYAIPGLYNSFFSVTEEPYTKASNFLI